MYELKHWQKKSTNLIFAANLVIYWLILTDSHTGDTDREVNNADCQDNRI